jgi:hypothetical protein
VSGQKLWRLLYWQCYEVHCTKLFCWRFKSHFSGTEVLKNKSSRNSVVSQTIGTQTALRFLSILRGQDKFRTETLMYTTEWYQIWEKNLLWRKGASLFLRLHLRPAAVSHSLLAAYSISPQPLRIHKVVYVRDL